MNLYSDKQKNYFSNSRKDLIRFLPVKKNSKILEIGAGGGDTLIEIKKSGLACEVVGIELFEIPGTNQTHPEIDKFIIADIETMDINLPHNYFDAILCGDVLEHLIDPWGVVQKLKKYLAIGGLLIASIPNIREISALSKIVLKGNFQYGERGIFDRTHIKFFCKKNMIDLMSPDGLEIVAVVTPLRFTPAVTKRNLFNKLTFKIFEEFLAIHYIVVSKKIA